MGTKKVEINGQKYPIEEEFSRNEISGLDRKIFELSKSIEAFQRDMELNDIALESDRKRLLDLNLRIYKIEETNKLMMRRGCMILPQKVYEVIRWVVAIVIPALIVLYGVIATTCHIPFATETLIIASAVETFLGTIFGLSKISYDRLNKIEEVNKIE